MRTPLVWTLKVTISPWNSLPTFLKEPMLAMSLLLGCFEPATTAASMAIGKPEAIDDAPALRAGAQRRMAAVRLSCLARNGRTGVPTGPAPWGGDPRGRKSIRPPLRPRRSRCQPSFGQIKPWRGPSGPRAEQHSREKIWRTSIAAHKRSGFPGAETEALAQREDGALAVNDRAVDTYPRNPSGFLSD